MIGMFLMPGKRLDPTRICIITGPNHLEVIDPSKGEK